MVGGENVDWDYSTGLVPLSSDKSQSLKDFLVWRKCEVKSTVISLPFNLIIIIDGTKYNGKYLYFLV